MSGEGAYVRYEMWLRALETRVNSLVGLSGSFFAARRDVCRNWAADRQSDFSTALNAVDLGLRAVLDPETAGYYRNIVDDRRERGRKTRTVVRGLAVLARNAPDAESLSLRALRVAARQPQAVPLAGADGDDRGGRREPVLLSRVAGLRRRPSRMQMRVLRRRRRSARGRAPAALRIPSFLLLSHAAILIAWCRFARGERMTCWTPSRRLATLPPLNPR